MVKLLLHVDLKTGMNADDTLLKKSPITREKSAHLQQHAAPMRRHVLDAKLLDEAQNQFVGHELGDRAAARRMRRRRHHDAPVERAARGSGGSSTGIGRVAARCRGKEGRRRIGSSRGGGGGSRGRGGRHFFAGVLGAQRILVQRASLINDVMVLIDQEHNDCSGSRGNRVLYT